jgi:HD-GYP domain-containing protein (c-di-GMP phosphodiesterase class II)
VVDVYDALTNDRCYRKALGRDAALSLMARETDQGSWDHEIFADFRQMILGEGEGEGEGTAADAACG